MNWCIHWDRIILVITVLLGVGGLICTSLWLAWGNYDTPWYAKLWSLCFVVFVVGVPLYQLFMWLFTC